MDKTKPIEKSSNKKLKFEISKTGSLTSNKLISVPSKANSYKPKN